MMPTLKGGVMAKHTILAAIGYRWAVRPQTVRPVATAAVANVLAMVRRQPRVLCPSMYTDVEGNRLIINLKS